MHGICYGERVGVGVYRVGVGGEVGQYNRMYTCILYMGLELENKSGFNEGIGVWGWSVSRGKGE